jgi:hypothetical protein
MWTLQQRILLTPCSPPTKPSPTWSGHMGQDPGPCILLEAKSALQVDGPMVQTHLRQAKFWLWSQKGLGSNWSSVIFLAEGPKGQVPTSQSLRVRSWKTGVISPLAPPASQEHQMKATSHAVSWNFSNQRQKHHWWRRRYLLCGWGAEHFTVA